MSGFDILQGAFVGAELSALGLSSPGAEVVQPAAVLPDGDDAALWNWFDTIPSAGPIYAPADTSFFTAYADVIDALVASGAPLDPVTAAKNRLADWGNAPPTWSSGCAGMSRQLAGAASLGFPFDAPEAPRPEFWGLIGSPPLGPSALFASGAVSASVTCAHVLNFAPRPGDWYVSSALSLAYRKPGAAPWDPASPITWDTTFGPNGTLPRMLASLIVVSGLDVAATSTASFDAANQSLVTAGAKAGGLWPYYLPAGAATTQAAFDGDGRLDLTTRSRGKTAAALVAVVLSAAAYLGA